VPVLQLIDPIRLSVQRRRHGGELSDTVVEHGRSGLLSPTLQELTNALGDVLSDSMPARAVARGARRRVDPAAAWDSLLEAILQ